MKAVLALAVLLAAAPARAGDWRVALASAAAGRDEVSTRLDQTFKELRARAAAEAPQLVAKLDGQPAKPPPVGYGLVPAIAPDASEPPGEPPAPGERHYDLRELLDAIAGEKDAVFVLQGKLARRQAPLAQLVDDYLERRKRLDLLDAHVKYHQSWQPQAEASAGFFAQRNALLADYRVWRSTSASAAEKAAAQRRLEDGLVQFSPAPGVRLEGPSGRRLLRVPLQTDIEDEAFLKAFEEGVERVWNRSDAMRQAGLQIRIDWKRRAPRELYAQGRPAKGAALDMNAHLARFGPGALILTTGAATTQAYPGRAITLGSSPIDRHSLAHEFSHILGFSDGYLRAFDGSPKDPLGVVFWEITPFPGDLLSDPGLGRVTPAMVRKLVDGYTPAAGTR